MGVVLVGRWSRANKVILALAVTFAMLTGAIAGLSLKAEGSFTPSAFKPHSPIYINGNADFGSKDGVTGGSGTEADPFVIEGWEISAAEGSQIAVNNTDAYLVIRNVSLSGPWSYYGGLAGIVGISLNNASNVKIESSFMTYLQSGVRARGTVGITEGIEISRCTFTYVIQHVSISNTSDCLVTGSSFSGYFDQVIHFSNCTAVSCYFNVIDVDHPYYYAASSMARVVMADNVTSFALEKNDITAYGDMECVRMLHTVDATATNNSVHCQNYYDFVVEESSRVQISYNGISRGDGISVRNSRGVSVDENILSVDTYAMGDPGVFTSDSEDVTISGNSIIRGGGIVLTNTRDSLVHDNFVADTGFFSYYSDFVRGLWCYGGKNLTISRNVIVNGTASAMVLSGTNITVEGNEIGGNWRTEKAGSYAEGGFYASGSKLTIRSNRFSSNTVGTPTFVPGIKLYMCSNSTFESNNISDDVRLEYCDNLTVKSNTFAAGGNISVFSWGDIAVFQGNNFLQPVTIDIESSEDATHWDAGYPGGGNYWSTYTGADLMSGASQDIPGPDGFGDTAYPVAGAELDNYPLMRPAVVQDSFAPVTIPIINGTLGDRMWYTSGVDVTLLAFDSNMSLPVTSYRLDSGTWSTYTAQIPVRGDGGHVLQFRSEDDQGNLEGAKTVVIRIDTHAPFLTSDLQGEYKFRTRTADTRYIHTDFEDNASGVALSSLTYYADYWGYFYRTFTESSSDWLPLSPETGRRNATIEAFDGAGNSRTFELKIVASISPNTDPLNHEGPYGWWLIIAVVVDLGVGLTALSMLASGREGRRPGGKWTRRDEAERHYDEDVVDGYPKYMKRM